MKMNSFKSAVLCLVILTYIDDVFSQRSPYAGSRPSGYKDKFRPKPDPSTTNALGSEDRFGGVDNRIDGPQRPPLSGVHVVQGEPNTGQDPILSPARPVSNQIPQLDRLPYDALGDAYLVYLLLNRPMDQQPFWLVNYQAIEAHRNSPTVQNYNPTVQRPFFAG